MIDTGPLLRQASRLSGLPVRRAVPAKTLTAARYDAARAREYPRAVREAERALYDKLGLRARSVTAAPSRAWYDPLGRRLLFRGAARASRATLVHELTRALIDQSFNLRRLKGLRARDRDRALAGYAIVDGAAALASRRAATRLRGTPLDRFLQHEREAGLGAGRALALELRTIGGRAAVNSALRTFPQTTEQLLHIDKFLERQRAAALNLPATAAGAPLGWSETFGELHVRSLLQAFGVSGAAAAAGGWGAGRAALYGDTAVVVLRWDSLEDALEWRAAVERYAAAAFPAAPPRDCPPLDRCWGTAAAGVLGRVSVLAGGPAADTVAAALLPQL